VTSKHSDDYRDREAGGVARAYPYPARQRPFPMPASFHAAHREAAREQLPPTYTEPSGRVRFEGYPSEITACGCGMAYNSRKFSACVFCDSQTYNPYPAI